MAITVGGVSAYNYSNSSSVAITVALLGSYLGVSACIVTALQLGLDQMPDASSDNIISFIKWFIFSALFGSWISEIILRSSILHDYPSDMEDESTPIHSDCTL